MPTSVEALFAQKMISVVGFKSRVSNIDFFLQNKLKTFKSNKEIELKMSASDSICFCLFNKGGLISRVFHFGSNLKKKVPNHIFSVGR